MDKLMNAAAGADITGAVENIKESRVNVLKFSRIIAQVYSASCIDFRGVQESDIMARVDELMSEERIVKPFLRKGVTHDIVSLREALIWTGYMVVTGESKRIKFTLMVDSETAANNQEMKLREPGAWTSFLVDRKKIDTYYIGVQGINYVFENLGTSMNSYEVTLREV